MGGPYLGVVLTRGYFRVQGAWLFSCQVSHGMGVASSRVGCLGHIDMCVVLEEGGPVTVVDYPDERCDSLSGSA